MRTSIKYVLVFFALIAMIGIGLTLFSGDSEARLCVWDGGDAGALASTAANWDTDTAPVAGDNILFDGLNASGDDACTWDLATNSFGTFTIGAGYSGTITQSSDMHISGYSQAGGTFTPINTKWVYCNGDFYAGTITNMVLNLNMTKDGSTVHMTTIQVRYLIVSSDVIFNAISGYSFFQLAKINFGCSLNISSGDNFRLVETLYNYGVINGPGKFYLDSLATIRDCYLGIVNTNVDLILRSGAVSNNGYKLISDSIISGILYIKSDDTTDCGVLDLNGHSLTATTITVGTRGILDCGNGTITCSALTSTSGTIIEDTATWIFNDGAVVTATSGEKFYNVQMKGDCDFVNAVNVTNELRWIDVPTEYGALDVYLDSIYSQTIPTYTFGPEQTAAAEYSYLPDVQISMSQFYEDIDFSIYAYINTNLPVTYNITGTSSSWLSYHEGRIVGMPPDIGNYTYTITATHASGSVDVVNGYILVGSLSTAEYSYDQIWGLILWIVITAFMLIGLLLNIPLIQIVAFMGTIGSIVASLRIPEFEVFLMMFALGNSALFFIGMVRYRR